MVGALCVNVSFVCRFLEIGDSNRGYLLELMLSKVMYESRARVRKVRDFFSSGANFEDSNTASLLKSGSKMDIFDALATPIQIAGLRHCCFFFLFGQ